MDAPAKKKAFIERDFKDAGTGESFTAGDTPLIDAGAFENYKAAGLVSAAPAAKAAAKPKASTKPKAKATKPAKPSLTPTPTPAPIGGTVTGGGGGAGAPDA